MNLRPRKLLCCALLALGLVSLLSCGEEEKPPAPTIESKRYLPPPKEEVTLPPIPFVQAAEASGLRFRHETGGFETKKGESRFLPECMGSGVILFDPDGDGDSDVFFANSGWFEGHAGEGDAPTSRCFRNDGELRFTDVSEAWGLAISAYGMGGAAADYDGDGDQDLLLTTWGGPRLFRNEGAGKPFVEVTKQAGLQSKGWVDEKGRKGPDWSTGAAFFDADRDGDLDLFVCNYVRWTPETDIHFSFDGRFKSFTVPDRYQGNSCRFFRNEGEGRFADVTKASGVENQDGKSLGVSLWDFDDDGDLDLVVSNDQAPNFLYRNLGDCRFEEIGLDAGIAYDENGRVRAGMGIDVADYLNDGVPGIPIGNFSREPVALYRREAKVVFRDVTHEAGVAPATLMELSFGLCFADFDLDGWQDIAIANGHLEPRVQEIWAEIPYAQAPLLLRNQGNGRFARWNGMAGDAFNKPLVGRGLACADLDGDGDLDLVGSQNGRGAVLLRNDCPKPGNWLRVRLQGPPGNRDGIGAMIEVRSGERVQRRLVKTGSSYLSQSEFVQTFGLGDGVANRIRVYWPDGRQSMIDGEPLIPRRAERVVKYR